MLVKMIHEKQINSIFNEMETDIIKSIVYTSY